MRRWQGFTLIELVIVVAVIGVLAAIAFVSLPRDHFAVNQAARGFAQQFPRARLEALKNDAFAGIAVDTSGAGSYAVCVAPTGSTTCGTSQAIQSVSMGTGANGQVRIATVSAGLTPFMFDPRGIPWGSAGTVTFQNRSGSYGVTVNITAAGKANVQ